MHHGSRRSPHGERGLKSTFMAVNNGSARRSPHGERGLKFFFGRRWGSGFLSLSSRRAWIEIIRALIGQFRPSSLSSRRAWIEIVLIGFPLLVASRSPHGERGLKSSRWRRSARPLPRSLSSRRAWIEITMLRTERHPAAVALLTESVD